LGYFPVFLLFLNNFALNLSLACPSAGRDYLANFLLSPVQLAQPFFDLTTALAELLYPLKQLA
jgi:hypothetical protein